MGIANTVRGAFRVGRLLLGSSGGGFALIGTVAGIPSNGTSGTGAGLAPPGSYVIDTTNAELYRNYNTQASPAWSCISRLATAFAKYSFAVDGGAQGAITPATTSIIPDNAIVLHVVINPTTAVTSLGSATLAVGTTAGSSATAFIGATAKATLSLDALLLGTPTIATAATWVKMTALGSINVTVGTADLTAGVVEITALYLRARA